MAREDGSLARSAAAVHVVRLSARQQGLRAGARVAKRWELNTVLLLTLTTEQQWAWPTTLANARPGQQQ